MHLRHPPSARLWPLMLLSAASLAAQEPVYSIGQPPTWRQHVALQGGVYSKEHQNDVAITYGAFHSFNIPPIPALNPVLGVIGGTLEGYGSFAGRHDGAGVRALATSRMLALSIGADWDIRRKSVATILSWQSSIRRGGLFGHGSMLRVDWLPARDRIVRVGVTAPIAQPLSGRTRPRKTSATIHSEPATTSLSLARDDKNVRELELTSAVIAAYSDLYTDDAVRTSATMSYRDAIERSRIALEQMFYASLPSTAAQTVARRARLSMLDYVLIPVDSLFGRPKKVDVDQLAARASANFDRWVRDSSGIQPSGQEAARTAFAGMLSAMIKPVRAIVERSDDSRLIWLPLDLALTTEDYDDQIEVDSLIGRIVGHTFTDRNALSYLRSADLPLEVARSIYAAREYHVMWTHEFMGRFWETRDIDDIGYQMVSDVYFPALINAVRRYDSTGVFPVYMMMHDQFFYEVSDGRLWLSILEDPLNASTHLAKDDGTREQHLRERQAELRAAIASSQRLQRDAQASGDAKRWLRGTVKVHVNVGNPSDFSFRSGKIIPGIPFAPDNLMRDHRKIVIYDVNEADPYKGGMFVMGIGIGEVYSSPTWEDRGYRVRGPATLEARAALRRALIRNGFTEENIPAPLRPVASKKAEEKRMDLGSFVGRALLVNNDVGFGVKESSVARALLYSLAQPASVIVVPDQLWFSETWAGMLTGAAARGARIHIVAPALANAPIPDPPAMARAHDVLLRLIELRTALASQIRTSGGDLRIGLFAALAPANDATGRLREVREGLARSPWIQDVIPFDAKTLAVLDRAELTSSDGKDAGHIAHDEKPKAPQPHRKTQLIARPGAIAALVRQPGWEVALTDAMRVQSSQTAKFAEQLGLNPEPDTAATRRADEMMRGYEASIPEGERKRVSFYFTEGSHNMDPRGLGSDGEAMLIVSGPQASAGLVDLFYMMARTTWVTNEAELNALLPPQSRLIHWFARWIKATL